jgi:hypothetical protein
MEVSNQKKPEMNLSQLQADVGENRLIGTWKLQSLVYEATATGQRSSPFGDHPDGYLSYSPDGRNSKGACSPMQERIWQTVRRSSIK